MLSARPSAEVSPRAHGRGTMAVKGEKAELFSPNLAFFKLRREFATPSTVSLIELSSSCPSQADRNWR